MICLWNIRTYCAAMMSKAMTDNKEFATCSCCGKTVKKGDMYFRAWFLTDMKL